MGKRPGSDAAMRLFKSNDKDKWDAALKVYEACVKGIKVTKTTKGNPSTTPTLSPIRLS